MTSSSNFVWLPLTNTRSFGEQLIAGDLIEDVLSEEHTEALLTLSDIYNVRMGIWGDPSDDAVNHQPSVEEVGKYSTHYMLASFAYYIGVSLQFLLTVQLNPIYTVDGILRVGKAERQARTLAKMLSAFIDRYLTCLPGKQEDSNMLKYAKHMLPVLDRMGASDIFNPINKECLPLERLRGLAGGRVSIHGLPKGWIVRSPKGKKIAQNVDGGLAIMEAISTLQYTK